MPPSEDRGPLTQQLQLWAAFLVGVVLLASVLTVVVDVTPTLPVALPLGLSVAMVAAAVLAVVGIDRVFAATPPDDDTAAVAELRTRLVLQSVLAETLVLATTILAAMVGPRWNIAIGGIGCGGDPAARAARDRAASPGSTPPGRPRATTSPWSAR
jgi:hypothetical protein